MVREVAWRVWPVLANAAGHPLGEAMRLTARSSAWSPERLAEHRHAAFRALMAHCYQHVPYYRAIMQERRLTPEDFRTVEDLRKLPYLTKDLIRQHARELRATNFPDAVCQVRRSGGTTGEPIAVAVNTRARAYEVACYMRGFEWMGYRRGWPLVRLFGGSLGLPKQRTLRTRIREWLLNNYFLPAFELDPDNVEEYVQAIRGARRGSLVGYSSAVYNLAAFMARRGLTVDNLSSIICTADPLPDEWRSRIQEVFSAPVYLYYGCGEIYSLGYQHPDYDGTYLVPQEHAVLEAATGHAGEFHEHGTGQTGITSLYNYSMPLIRYLNGDRYTLEGPSGVFPYQRITTLHGRTMELLVATDGHPVSGALAAHLVYMSGAPVWKWQAIQVEKDRIEFHYLVEHDGGLTDAMQKTLLEVFRKHLGADMRVDLVAGAFHVPASQKHLPVINRVA